MEMVVQFITVLLIFIFVLAVTYFSTRYIAQFQKQKMETGNLEVLEMTRIGNNKYLQIVKAGDKYLLIALSKDTVTMLTELSGESLSHSAATDAMAPLDFKAILEKSKELMKAKNAEKQADKDE